MVRGMVVSVGVAVVCHLSMVEIAGLEPVCYCTFPIPESKYSEVKYPKNPFSLQRQWPSGYIPWLLTYMPQFNTGYCQKFLIKQISG